MKASTTAIIALLTGVSGYFLSKHNLLSTQTSSDTANQVYETTVTIEFESNKKLTLQQKKNLLKAYPHAEPILNEILDRYRTIQQSEPELIKVTTTSDSERTTEQLAQKVLELYEKRKLERIKKLKTELTELFQKKIKAQEKEVEEKRKKLLQLSRQLGIPYDKAKSLDSTPKTQR